jgi:hypothetical protein
MVGCMFLSVADRDSATDMAQSTRGDEWNDTLIISTGRRGRTGRRDAVAGVRAPTRQQEA